MPQGTSFGETLFVVSCISRSCLYVRYVTIRLKRVLSEIKTFLA